ncbi:hypothetical protein BRARA_E03232 [Brassica rapa]|uniref:1,3-beta-glucan synthase n=1 Tax=Brassica campestris TaxID=3711 RepID=A0A397ZH44_BRACM|nr:hypothetical protein BRARA_E03232 [Brassica rapa]CAG7878192.1 unnamed protein product [Brassica rapa]
MSRAESSWERLVNAALQRDRAGGASAGGGGPGQGSLMEYVPSSLANNRDIDAILRAADELQDEDPSIARILCEHAYSLAQNLDPNSEGRGVLQFKTGLMSVVKQKLAKREVGTIDRSQDIKRLQDFYRLYREKNNVDTLKEDEKQLRESGVFTKEMERKTLRRKRVFATLKVLGNVLEQVAKEIPDELKHVIDSDAAMSEDTIAYNIIPLDAPVTTNATTSFPEVQAAVAALKYFPGLPKLPADFPIPATRNADMLDFLHYIFGFQKDSVSNQREHIVLLLANEQSRLTIPEEREPKLDDAAVRKVFLKSLDNYIKWCDYLCIQPAWSNLETISGEKRLLFLSLYFLIWGEAANIRFLPECLCYIFHHMVREMDEILRQQVARPAESCMPVESRGSDDGVSFLDHVIAPLYGVVSAEAFNNDNGRASHSAWRNYDDFNEYFWSLHSFELGWPWRTSSSFFQKPIPRKKYDLQTGRAKHRGKTSFVEHRTFLHLYHSFHRLWIFLAMMFQALAIIAFNKNDLYSRKTLREILSLGPTFVVMKFSESVLDVIMMYGAYSTTRRLAVSRIFLRFIWFSLASVVVSFLYVKAFQEDSNPNSNSVMFKFYVILIAIYGGVQFFLSILMRFPTCHNIANKCDRWPVIRFFKWMRQERHYVGRGMYEKTSDFIKYLLFWVVVLSAKFSFAYFLQIKPLVGPTRMIVKQDNIQYSWHDLVSRNNYNALTVASLWAPVVAIYLLDIHIFYTLVSAFLGFLLGARDRLGEIRSLEAIHKQFEEFPGAFMRALHVPITNRTSDPSHQAADKNKVDAAHFAPFWNQIIKCLREEDYITDFEMDLLLMPKNSGRLQLVQWPLFLLSSKILLAKEIAAESNTQEEIIERIERDDYMKYAVEEVYHTLKLVLMETLEAEGRMWVERIYEDIQASIKDRKIHHDFQLNKLSLVITRVTALLGILKENETPEHAKGAIKALQDLYDVMRLDILTFNMRGQYETWNILTQAWNEGRLFTKLKWPKDPELKALVKRLYSLFTIKDSAAHVPRNLEARRRLQFFTNSLFMDVPPPKSVDKMLSFSVFTPYYSEVVLYSMAELTKRNEDGISILFYLQKIYPDEWKNFLARIGQDENALEGDLRNERDILELRFWASYRGQTLARTVRGMMYYRKALMLQSYLERKAGRDGESTPFGNDATDSEGFELSPEARAQADLKFTYVVTCQIYGRQKEDQKPEAADIALLMQRNEALRIAYIDVVDTPKEGKSHTEYYSKLVKADISGKDKEIYSIRLPGDPKLGEGKPENQNHAIVFTRGNAVQTIDMNQDNYFEEALKMRNLLEEFDPNRGHGIRPPTILGVREHVFTGSVSSLASFMSNQETSFVTLGQRVLAKPLKIRMHYGHPDVFDRVFHITRGGISKASRVINISEDIFAGFNSTLRQGNITHHEYIQVGKGRDVGLNQIALFEGKVAGGNGEQVLSRDVYRLGQLLDFFRMMSFYFTTVGFYFCTMLTVLTVYIFLYGRLYLALSGVGATIRERAILLDDTALSAALNAQFLFQIGVFTAVPMILGFILEQGFLQAIVSFTTMQFQLCTIFFTFSLGTRTHYFGRTILHGGARYQATGRGFVVKHIKFSENYRLYSRSHFIKAMEVILLLVVYLSYGNDEAGAVSYILLTVSSWFLAVSWLFAPYLFNPAGFEWQKVVEDFKEWTNWLFYRGGIGVKGAESWEAWWEEEISHIRTLSGRIVETILSLRFFIFQYGIVYKLNLQGSDTSIAVYGWSWAAFAMLIVLFKVFTFSQKVSVNFQLVLRFVQGVSLLVALAGIVVAIVLTNLSVTDIFASILAFIPTGWGILSIACAWKPVIKRLGMWKSVRSLARLFDAGMGMLIFLPVALCSWFPFVSTFQTRMMFNQAFSRGLEISLILAGNNPNSGL